MQLAGGGRQVWDVGEQWPQVAERSEKPRENRATDQLEESTKVTFADQFKPILGGRTDLQPGLDALDADQEQQQPVELHHCVKMIGLCLSSIINCCTWEKLYASPFTYVCVSVCVCVCVDEGPLPSTSMP
mmetsp:Transcript_14603/g.31604  ORF Transcript_14603/g.31604 Transcript_14603/m.31604 type:complete len:130 (-) Transcript_14603:289-678(-)